MKNNRLRWAVTASVVGISCLGIATAQAATQYASQYTVTEQGQTADVAGPGSVAQDASAQVQVGQHEINQAPASGISVSQSNLNGSQEQSQSQTTTTAAQFQQGQGLQVSSTQTQSSQFGPAAATDPPASTSNDGSPGQNKANVLSNANAAIINNVNPYAYIIATLPVTPANQLAGYGVFDANGHLLSASYGIYPNQNNNTASHYFNFTPNQPITVYIKAVDSHGTPISSPNTVTLYLRSSNFNGQFQLPTSSTPVTSVTMQTGSNGVEIVYTNNSSAQGFDALSTGTDNPNYHPVQLATTQTAAVTVGETQQASTTSGGTFTQTQSTQSTSTASQDPSNTNTTSDTTTSDPTSNTTSNTTSDPTSNTTTSDPTSSTAQSLAAASGTTQNQTANLQGAGQVNQQQQTTASVNQQLSNATDPTQSQDVTTTQAETAATTDPATLSQGQSVTVDNPVINVTFTQTQSADSGTVAVNESIDANLPNSAPSLNNPNTKVINVRIGDATQQLDIQSTGSVTFNESQSVQTGSDGGPATQDQISMDYTYGSQNYHYVLR